MDMHDRLLTVVSTIKYSPVSIREAFRSGYFACGGKEMSDQFFILFSYIVQSWNRFSGYNKNMSRCMGINVAKSEAQVVFVYDIRWNITACYLFKKCFFMFPLQLGSNYSQLYLWDRFFNEI